MTRITEASFVRSLQNQEIDASKLDRKLKAADVDGDGVVKGDVEAKALFKAVDDFDKNGTRRSIESSAAPVARVLGQIDGARRPARGIGSGGASGNAGPQNPANPANPNGPTTTPATTLPAGRTVGTPTGTGYYPANTRMEGGFVDKRDKPLQTLQSYVEARQQHPNDPSKWPPYVSIALDKRLYENGVIKYGDKFRIPELEKKFGMPIEFRAVDTGGAFTNKGFSRIDICTGSRRDSLDSTINGRLTLQRI